MPVFNDLNNPDSYIGFDTSTFTGIKDAVVSVEDAIDFSSLGIGNYSSIAMLWWANIRIESFNPSVVKFWDNTTSRANFGSYVIQHRGASYTYVYLNRTGNRVPPHKLWWYNPVFYAGNRYIPSEATYAAQLSGEFPLDVGFSPKPVAVFSAVDSPGDAVRVSVANGVDSFSVTITYQIWGTTLFPGATAPVTFIEV